MTEQGEAAVREAAVKAEAAAQKAETAAVRAERASTRTRYLLGGFLFALVGAVLAFALKDSDASVLGVSLRPLGGVLFAAGVLLVAGAAIGSMRGGGGGDCSKGGVGGGDCSTGTGESSIKEIGGLIAVISGITVVGALAVVTLTQLGSKEESSIVAVTSSAFGVISAVVGAYLGIKISADTSAKAGDDAKDAAVARHIASVASSELDAVTDKVDELVTPEQASAIKAATVGVGKEEARTAGPARGGGHV
jgi:hypothetical protein